MIFDMDLKKGRVVVDAKSLLGIVHLGINNIIELQVYEDIVKTNTKRFPSMLHRTACLIKLPAYNIHWEVLFS